VALVERCSFNLLDRGTELLGAADFLVDALLCLASLVGGVLGELDLLNATRGGKSFSTLISMNRRPNLLPTLEVHGLFCGRQLRPHQVLVDFPQLRLERVSIHDEALDFAPLQFQCGVIAVLPSHDFVSIDLGAVLYLPAWTHADRCTKSESLHALGQWPNTPFVNPATIIFRVDERDWYRLRLHFSRPPSNGVPAIRTFAFGAIFTIESRRWSNQAFHAMDAVSADWLLAPVSKRRRFISSSRVLRASPFARASSSASPFQNSVATSG